MRAYVANNYSSNPYYYAQDQMERWDDEFYRTQIVKHGLDGVIRNDWKRHWRLGAETHKTLKSAERYADRNNLRHVVEIDLDVLRVAYTQTFGETA